MCHMSQLRDATVSMPSRVERMDDIIRQLEAGDIKLRVRVLEVASRLNNSISILHLRSDTHCLSGSCLKVHLFKKASRGAVTCFPFWCFRLSEQIVVRAFCKP